MADVSGGLWSHFNHGLEPESDQEVRWGYKTSKLPLPTHFLHLASLYLLKVLQSSQTAPPEYQVFKHVSPGETLHTPAATECYLLGLYTDNSDV